MKTSLPPFVHSFPAPAVLIGCGTLERPNLITCSWFGTVCSEPPMVSVSVRESRHSFQLIHESREFTVNIPRVVDLAAVQYCGSVSGRNVDKFQHLGLSPQACPPLVHAPMIAEFRLALGCRVKHEMHLGTHHMFIADVVRVFGEEVTTRAGHRPDLFAAEQIAYLNGTYWRLTAIEGETKV